MKQFVRTVMVVTIFSVCEKFLGFLYRIFLSRTIGSEGIGLYQVALSVFALILTIVCSGTPITVSRLMTKYRAENQIEKVYKVISAGISFTLAVALPVALFFMVFGKKFTFMFADERCMKIFLVLVPGLIFTSVYSVLRGVFWGNKDFLPYSVTELLEEICMIVVGIILIRNCTDIYQGAFRAGLAVLISYIFSFSLASIMFAVRKNKLKNPSNQFKPLLKSALPVTAMRTANSLSSSLVSILLPARLIAVGFSPTEAMSAFGASMGQAMPLLFIPITLIGSFILVLIPEISENYYSGRDYYLKRDVEKALKFSFFLTAVFVPVFFVCGEEIGVLVFSSYECGKYLSAFSFLMPFISLSSLTTSILNSIGLEHKTLGCFIISGAFMLASAFFLPAFIGIYALLVGLSFVYGLSTILNLVLIHKHCKKKPQYLKFFFSSALFILPACAIGLVLEKLLLARLGSLLSLAVISIIISAIFCGLCLLFNLSDLKSFRTAKNKNLKQKRSATI
ncbi:MAG: oligosaccharide flippase family protein [Clostridia bacterium]|nr:oligosaccharide flippase family protein [Clostridia bacterium]